MTRRKATRVAPFLALALMLFITTGMPLLHPWLHAHHAAHKGALADTDARSGQPEARPAVQDADGDDDCPICRFLSTFPVNNPSSPCAVVRVFIVVARLTLPTFPLSQQFLGFSLSARAPPC
jgi:hypothetical protein